MMERLVIAALSWAMFCRMLGVFMALPVAAVYAESLGGESRGWIAGLAVGAYGITQAALQIPMGMLADRFGRKPILLSALAVFVGGSALCAAADSATMLILGRLLAGGGAAASVVAAWIGDVSAPRRRAAAMMIFGAAIGAAFVFSLFLSPTLAGRTGIAGVFQVAAGLGVAAFLTVAFLPAPPMPTTAPSLLREIIADAPLRRLAAGAFVLHYGLAAVWTHLPPILSESLPLPLHWRLYTPAFALSLLIAIPLIIRADRRLLPFPLAILLVFAGVLVLFAGGRHPPVAGAGLFLFFAGFVALEAILPARASRIAPVQGRATALGLVLTCQFLGVFAGAFLCGAVQDLGGTAGAAAAASLPVLAWFVVVWAESSKTLTMKKEKEWEKAA